MTDREKVIKELEVHLKGNSRCNGCPYPNNGLCGDKLMADALALIREQQEEIQRLCDALKPEPPKEEDDGN